MSFMYFDTLQFICFIGICFICYKLHTKKMYKSIFAIALLVFGYLFTTPVVMHEQNGSAFTADKKQLPEKVLSESKSFEQKQAEKLKKLKSESKEIEGEI